MTSSKPGLVLKQDDFRKLKMPDEDCRSLLWAVTMGYLLPVRNNEIIFMERFENIFGAESDSVKSVRELILKYPSNEIYRDPRLIELVTQVFRDRVIGQVSKREVDKDKENVNCDEIEAIKCLLHCQINVFDGQLNQLTLEQNNCATIFLFLNKNNFELCLVHPKIIIEALKNINYKLALSLVKIGVEGVNDADDVGWTLLHYATTTDDYHHLIQRLVDQGADLNLKNRNHQTALDLARFLKQEKSIAALTNYLGNNSEVIKQQAIIPYSFENIKGLLKQTCSDTFNAVNAINSITKNESIDLRIENFGLALLNNDVQAVRKFINNGIDVNQKIILEDGSSCYPIHVATQKGYLQMVKILVLEGKSKVDIRDSNGATPLYAAAQSGSNLILDYLIDKGAEVNAVDARGMTPLHHSVLKNQWKAVFSLVEHEADLNLLNDQGQTALSMVISKGNWEIVRYLLENGAFLIGLCDEIIGDIYRRFIGNLSKDELLHQAVALGNVELLHRLIRENSIENEALFEIYNEFRLFNVKLSSEISIFMENKLMDDRYYSDKQVSEEKVKDDFDVEKFNVKGRIQLVINCVDTLLLYDNEVNDVFLFIIKFIVKNLQVLKQFLEALPCEEMQFCLSTFLMTYLEPLKIDVCVNLVLYKKKILNYLSDFKNELLKLNVDQLNLNVQSSRFKKLRKDFERLKDLLSLHKMDHYLSVACAVDLKDNPEVGKLVIERSLQVSGEFLKNTADSPNLSEKVQEELLNFAPVNTSKTVSNLRDVFSHVSSLVIKIHSIENNNNNVAYFQQIQNDLRHLKPGITYLLYSTNIKIINKFLKNIGNCESMEQVRDMTSGIERFDDLEVPFPVSVERDSYRVVEQLASYVEEFKKIKEIGEMSGHNRMLLNKSSDLIDKMQSRNYNIREIQAHLLKRFNELINSIKNENYSLEILQEKARLIIEKDLDKNCFNRELSSLSLLIDGTSALRPKPKNAKDGAVNLLSGYRRSRLGNTKAIDRFKTSLEHSNYVQENSLRLLNQLDEQFLAIEKTIQDDDVRDRFKVEYANQKEIHEAKNRLLQFYQQMPLISINFKEFTKLIEKVKGEFSKNLLKMSNSSSLYDKDRRSNCKKVADYINRTEIDIMGIFLKPIVKEPEKTDFSREILEYFTNNFESIKNLNLTLDLIQPTDSYVRKYFVDKLRVLESIFDLQKPDAELLKSLETSDELRLAIEMLALTLMQILENFSVFESNKLYLDEALPVLIGKNLRNYLAHGDLTIDALSIDPLKALIYHLRAIREKCSKTEFIVHNRNKRIGKIFQENIDETEAHFHQSLDILRKRDKVIETVKNNNLLKFRGLIVNDLELKYRDVNNRTLLYFSTKTDNLDFFKLLLNNDLNIYSRDKFQHSILYYLAKNNNLKILKFLKDHYNLNPNVIVTQGKSLLHLSAQFDHPELTNWLLSIDVHKDEFDNDSLTPLMMAITHKRPNIARILWKAKASLSQADLNRLQTLNMTSVLKKLFTYITSDELPNNKLSEIRTKTDQLFPETHVILTIDAIEDEEQKIAFINGLSAGEIHHTVMDEALKYTLQQLDFLTNASQQNGDVINDIVRTHFDTASLYGNVNNIKILMEKNYVTIEQSESGLLQAAGLGHQEIVEFLLEKGVGINKIAPNGDTILHKAALQDNVNIVRMLIEKDADIGLRVQAKNERGETALHRASKKGHCDVVELLLSAGADVNCVTDMGTSALHCAVLSNSLKTVELLLSRGADVNAVDQSSQSVAQLVCFNGDIKMLEILFKYGVNINVIYKRNNTPLSCAISAKKKNVVEFLLKKGADVNLCRFRDASPLHVAAHAGHLQILELLIKKNAKFTMDRTGHTPLHIAVFFGHAKIAETLLLKYKDTQVKDVDKTPLHYAACFGYDTIVDVLLKHGVDVDATDISKNSALHYAAVGGFYKIVEKLLLRNAKTALQNALGCTALHHAASKGAKNVIELLLKADKSTINAVNYEGNTPLHLAVQRAHLASVKLLLDNRADVRAKTTDSNLSPLHVAVEHGNCELVELLLDYGAKIDAEDKSLFTGLQYAVSEGKTRMVQALLKRGASVNKKETRGPFLTLFLAVNSGHDDIVTLLVKNGANVNAYFQGVSSLHMAAKFGQKTAAEILIKNGANVEALDGKKQTPAHNAAIHGHHELIKVLHRHRADLNARDIDNLTPIQYAVENKHTLCILYLFMFGADVSEVTGLHYAGLNTHEAIVKMVASDNRNETNIVSAVTDNSVTSSLLPSTMLNFTNDNIKNLLFTLGPNEAALENACANLIYSAVQSGDVASLKMLLNFNPDLNAKNERGSSPLHVAVSLGHYEISEVLISAGADVFSRNNHDSVLHQAVKKDEILKLVLAEIKKKCAGDLERLRSAVNAADAEGDTPLMWAVENGYLCATKLLLDFSGVDVNKQNLKGWTALYWAVHVGHPEIVNDLLDKRADVKVRNENGETAYDLAAAKRDKTEDAKYEVIAALLLSLSDDV